MSKTVATQKKQLPAHLQKFAPVDPEAGDKWGSGQQEGFPVISTKGKNFHIRRAGEAELMTNPQDPDEPATYINVVVLDTHPGTAKTFYKGKYVEGSDEKPTCYSNDGINPAPDAQNRQFKNCALCPRNQWGSRITEDGKKAKECSDVKRLAVVPMAHLNDPMLLRVPPTSLKAWDQYVKSVMKRGFLPEHMITKISFDHTVSHQAILFKPVNFVTEEMIPDLEEAIATGTIKSIIGQDDAAAALPPPDQDADEEIDTDTGEITKKAEGDDFDFDEDVSEAETAAAEAAAKKAATAAKRKATRLAKKKAEEDAAEAAALEAAGQPDDDDDFDFDDEDDDAEAKAAEAAALAKKKKAAATRKKNAAAKAAAEAAEAEADDDDDDDAQDDLDFDDLDFGD